MTKKPEALTDFPVVISLPVQWGDQDMFGHVNNTVYFRWCESARLHYMMQLGLGISRVAGELGLILAHIECNYRRQENFPDTVQIGARVTKIGRSSMVMEHAVWSTAQQALVADIRSTVVAFDYGANKSVPVPAFLRSQIEQLEGREFPPPAH